MGKSEIRIQVKAFDNYLRRLVEKLDTLDDTIDESDDAKSPFSEREMYFSSGEQEKIETRYEKLKERLLENYPDLFSDLMEADSMYSRRVEELSRELSYVLDVLDEIEDGNRDVSSSGSNSSDNSSLDNSPFNDREQENITYHLGEIRKQLIEIASEQDAPKEEIESNVKMINEKVDKHIESTKKIGRKDWTLQFLSFVLSLSLSLSTSQETRKTLLNAVQALINFIYNFRLLDS